MLAPVLAEALATATSDEDHPWGPDPQMLDAGRMLFREEFLEKMQNCLSLFQGWEGKRQSGVKGNGWKFISVMLFLISTQPYAFDKTMQKQQVVAIFHKY